MLRLAHRILFDGLEISADIAEAPYSDRMQWIGTKEELVNSIKTATIVIGDNIVDYFAQHPQMLCTGDLSKDCPCLAPTHE